MLWVRNDGKVSEDNAVCAMSLVDPLPCTLLNAHNCALLVLILFLFHCGCGGEIELVFLQKQRLFLKTRHEPLKHDAHCLYTLFPTTKCFHEIGNDHVILGDWCNPWGDRVVPELFIYLNYLYLAFLLKRTQGGELALNPLILPTPAQDTLLGTLRIPLNFYLIGLKFKIR